MHQQTWSPTDEDLEMEDTHRYSAADLQSGAGGNSNLDEDEDDIPPSQGG